MTARQAKQVTRTVARAGATVAAFAIVGAMASLAFVNVEAASPLGVAVWSGTLCGIAALTRQEWR